MTRSKQIAGLIGPTIVALAISEMLNLRIWEASIPAVVFLNGSILFVVGLAIIRAHNLWVRSWPVTVTVVGWIVFFGGLYRMLAPRAPQAPPSTTTYVGLALLLAFGLFLSFKAYWSRATLPRD